jgi:DNA-binding IclR family transcriptional regulator
MRAIVPLGYSGPGQVLTDEDDWSLDALLPQEETDAQTEDSPHEVKVVRSALDQHHAADIYDLMSTTGLSALEVTRALDALISDGVAEQAPDGSYAMCAAHR